MPIVWAQEPVNDVGGYGDILQYVSRFRRLDTFELALAQFDNGEFSIDPLRREAWLDGHAARVRARQQRQRKQRRPQK